MRPLFRIAAAAALCLAALPAMADTRPHRPSTARLQQDATAMCRADCMAAAASRTATGGVNAAQACAVRCGAASAYLAQQGRGGTAEATGRGQAARVALPATPVSLGAPAPAARGTQGVLYAARTPSAAFGMVVGGDRLAAHREAERRCAASGQGCRVVAEFTAACGAAVQGIKRSQWALFITSDPGSYVVTSLSSGSGATQQQAEQQAMLECRSRDPRATCRVVASACGTRG